MNGAKKTALLKKIRSFELTSWNVIGHDPKEFRHYSPMAQDFFTAFGHDRVDKSARRPRSTQDMAGILIIEVHALEQRTAELKQTQAQLAALAARLDTLELRQNQSIQVAREGSLV